ncbi:MAG: hypothetical protein NC212_09020 [Staphylococcus sp.]|nr:hypothetical protein [Staphylococcus sp.]
MDKDKLLFRKLQLESAIRNLMKIHKVMGILYEDRLNKLLDEYNSIVKKLGKD